MSTTTMGTTVGVYPGSTARTVIWLAGALALRLIAAPVPGDAQLRDTIPMPLQAGDRPSVRGVASGTLVGGFALAGATGLAGLLLTEGNTDCYEGGCGTLLAMAAAWPIGSALGATRVIRDEGFQVGFARILGYSLLGTGLGAGVALVVDETGAGSGPPDWAYVAAPLAAHVLTVALLSHGTISQDGRAPSLEVVPAVSRGRIGLTGRMRLR